MGTLPLLGNLLFGVYLLLLAINFANAGSQAETTVVVIGATECLDCSAKNMKTEHASKGLYVVIKCKANTAKYEEKSVGKLDSAGKFSVKLPSDLLQKDGKLKQECFAELHSASNTPCPEKPSELVFKSKEKGRHTFATTVEKLPFSSATCTSVFLWPPHNFPPKPKWDHFHKHLPWHKPFFKKPLPPPTPVPIYTPPMPEYKPPVSPVYIPPAPVYKTPVPAYKPPTAPVYKPPVPTPAVTYHKHPTIPSIFKKPHSPFYHPHPIYKKPLPPFYHSKFPPIHGWPPLPPYSPHPWKKYLKPKHHIFPPAKEAPKP
ncbi:proline-rich protein 2-like [Typha latifolia]|uniref:proline-rich protein 2-like n=1 Tax=Typha latifolia TaxID=4733 RepID=UPI003C2BC697